MKKNFNEMNLSEAKNIQDPWSHFEHIKIRNNYNPDLRGLTTLVRITAFDSSVNLSVLQRLSEKWLPEEIIPL